MSLPDEKALKILVKTCRKLGIKTFKNAEFEFTLSDIEPVVYKRRKRPSSASKDLGELTPPDALDSDSLTEQQLLMWSAADLEAPQDN